jgi:hypothetical protein
MPNRVWCERERRPRRRPRRGRGWGRPRRGRLRRRLGLGCVFISGRRGGLRRVLGGRRAVRRRGRRGGRRQGYRRAPGDARRRRRRRRGGRVAGPQRDRERDSHRGQGQDADEDGDARPEAHLLHAGVQHAPEPAGPAGPLTHDKARYMGIRGSAGSLARWLGRRPQPACAGLSHRSSWIGRTSIMPCQAVGCLAAISIASSRSAHSITS